MAASSHSTCSRNGRKSASPLQLESHSVRRGFNSVPGQSARDSDSSLCQSMLLPRSMEPAMKTDGPVSGCGSGVGGRMRCMCWCRSDYAAENYGFLDFLLTGYCTASCWLHEHARCQAGRQPPCWGRKKAGPQRGPAWFPAAGGAQAAAAPVSAAGALAPFLPTNSEALRLPSSNFSLKLAFMASALKLRVVPPEAKWAANTLPRA